MKKILLLTFLSFSFLFVKAQQTYTWAVASGDFDAASSWSPARTAPATNDILVFDGSVQSTATVTNIPSRETIGKLSLTNNSAVNFSSTVAAVTGTGTITRALTAVTGTGTAFTSTFVVGDIVNLASAANEVAGVTSATALTTAASGNVAAGSAYTIFSRITISGGTNALSITSGSTLTISSTTSVSLYVATGSTGSISGSLTFMGGAHRLNVNDASGVTFNSGSILTQGTGFSGNVFTATTAVPNTVIFASGSTFSVAAGSNPFALTVPASKVTFNSGSLFIQTSGSPSFSGRTYADFQLATGSASAISVSGGSAVSINNLIITGNSTLNWGMTATPGHAIKGNITVNAGSTLNFTGAGTTNLNGTALQSIISTNAIAINSGATLINGNTTGIVITPNTMVSIASGGTLNLNANPITLQSTSAGTGSIGAVNGTLSGATNVTAERYISDKRSWRLISPAVNSTQTINTAWQEGAGGTTNNPNPGYGTLFIGSSTANGFDLAGSSASLLSYDGTNLNSVPNTNSTQINSTPAYFFFSIGNRGVNPATAGVHSATTLRAKGTVVTGTQTPSIAATGFTLIGNPYPAAIDFAVVTKSTSIPDRFYAWDVNLGNYGGYVLISNSGGTYSSVPASPSGLTNVIASGAAFFVQSDGANTGTLTINESSKATAVGSNSFSNFVASAAPQNNFRVNLTDGASNMVDGVMASFAQGNSNAVDAADAPKLLNFYENIALKRSGKLLTLERRSDITVKDTIFVQMSGMKAAGYKLQIDPSAFSAQGMTAYLADAYLKTNTKLNLNSISAVAFTASADTASYKNRFSVTFVPTVDALKISHVGASVVAYPNPATNKQVNLSFDGLPNGTYNITMVDSFGHVMQKSSMIYNGTTSNKLLSANYTTGVYTVNVQSAGYNQSIKVIVP